MTRVTKTGCLQQYRYSGRGQESGPQCFVEDVFPLTAKLAVTVAVDMDATTVILRPAGRLTLNNVRALLTLVGRAGRVLPGFAAHLDLDLLHTGHPEAFRTLTDSGVRILPPHPLDARHGYRRPDLTTKLAA